MTSYVNPNSVYRQPNRPVYEPNKPTYTPPNNNPNSGIGGGNKPFGGLDISTLIQLLLQLLQGGNFGKPNPNGNPNGTPKPSNAAPVANNDTTSTQAGQAVNIGVLNNDRDPNGDPLTISSFGQGANGTVTQNGNQLTYTPKAGFTGTDTFNYTISDGKGGTSTATATVTVNPKPNTAPTAANDTGRTAFNTATTLSVLGNDKDADGDALSISTFTQPTNGTVTQNGNQLVYTPKAGFSGTDTFNYTVSDGKGGSATATATVTVDPRVGKPNDNPWGWHPTPNIPVIVKN